MFNVSWTSASEKFVDCKKETRKKAGGLAIIGLDKK
jgi:hypothetical protein